MHLFSDIFEVCYNHRQISVKMIMKNNTLQKKQEIFDIMKKVYRNNINISVDFIECTQLGLVVDPVIEAIARLEFEDGLRTGVLLGGCWCPWGGRTYPRINTKPPGGAGWSWVWCGCHKVPIYRPNSNSAEFRAWVVLNYSSYVVLG